MLRITSVVNWVVVEVPPISAVLTLPSFSTFFTASPIASAKIGRLRYLNIITELNIIEVGLTSFFPAILIPVLGRALEKRAWSFPMKAPGVIPTLPVIPAAIWVSILP